MDKIINGVLLRTDAEKYGANAATPQQIAITYGVIGFLAARLIK